MAIDAAPVYFDRRAVATKAMQASIRVRLEAQSDLVGPICIYDVCTKLGVRVTFNGIDMEGMYQRGRPPRIHLSALRPLPRRAYNCAHELGHHALGHGSTIDELREDRRVKSWDIPEEFMADTFAGFMLMPTLGLRHAFVARNLNPETAAPAQLYRIACHFRVGYRSLITHLHYGAAMISRARLVQLQKVTLRAIRAEILGALTPAPLIVVDTVSTPTTIDAEVAHLLLLPPGTRATGDRLVQVGELPAGPLFEARNPGIVQLTRPGTAWAAFARISRTAYIGRAEFRHLEDDSDD